MRPGNWLGALNCAAEGVLLAARTQRNLRIHLLAAVLVALAGWLANLPPYGFALLFLAMGLVIACEVMNSAVEAVVDLLAPEYAERARHAKDMAAGAVLVAAFASAFAGLMVLYPWAKRVIAGGLEAAAASPLPVALATLGATLVAVILLKARSGRGAPLQGGMPSGHAAVAFAAWGMLSLLTRDPLVVLVVLALAVMVSHSRMLMGIHSLAEVGVGAALGTAVSFLCYRLLALAAG